MTSPAWPNAPAAAYVRPEHKERLAKRWAAERNWRGAPGGWVYSERGRPIVQGWYNLYEHYRTDVLDWLTKRLTAFKTFAEMTDAKGQYRPSLIHRPDHPRDWMWQALADAYDVRQEQRGDRRRAYRGYCATRAKP